MKRALSVGALRSHLEKTLAHFWLGQGSCRGWYQTVWRFRSNILTCGLAVWEAFFPSLSTRMRIHCQRGSIIFRKPVNALVQGRPDDLLLLTSLQAWRCDNIFEQLLWLFVFCGKRKRLGAQKVVTFVHSITPKFLKVDETFWSLIENGNNEVSMASMVPRWNCSLWMEGEGPGAGSPCL